MEYDSFYSYEPIERLTDTAKRHNTQIFNESAVFSDGTRQYRIPEEPEAFSKVRLRIRTAHANIGTVVLVAGERRMKLKLVQEELFFDYYEGEITLTDERLEYYFVVWCGEDYYFYNSYGVSQELKKDYNFFITPGFATPEWAKGAVMYQIYADRFCNGSTTNNLCSHEYNYIGGHCVKVADWNKLPDVNGVNEFYGGDLEGVRKKLDYLRELGVEVIYFNPLFVSPSNHKYDTQDYDYIDPHIAVIRKDGGDVLAEGDGDNRNATKYIIRVTDRENLEASNEFFAALVSEIHECGMKVILDGVFNHCGSFNKWLDRQRIYEAQQGYEPGAYISEDSPYRSFFAFFREEWPYNDKYDGWWGHDTLPKLNYEESPLLFEYIMHIARKWISPPYNVDGWRLDVAADLGHSREYNHKFWRAFRDAVKAVNPNAIIIAEHYGDCSEWLQGGEWDTVMNYDAFMEPVSWFLTGMEKHSDEYRMDLHNNADAFFGAMRHHMSRMNIQSLEVAMNELSNHDHSRFLTRTNGRVGRLGKSSHMQAEENVDKSVMRAGVIIQMTWPGAPTIYYGDEVGVCGWTDPDNRRTYPWGNEDMSLLRFHREIIRLHKSYDALKTGSIKFLTGQRGVIAYGRFDSADRFVIAINNNNNDVNIAIPVWEIGIQDSDTLIRVMYSDGDSWRVDAVRYNSEHGVLQLHMRAHSAIVMKNLPTGLR